MTNTEPGSSSGARAESAVPGQRPAEAPPGLAPGEVLLHDDQFGRVTRVGSGDDALIRREMRGPNAAQRSRHSAAVMERLRGITGVPQLAGGVTGAIFHVRAFRGNSLRQLMRTPNWHLDLPALVDLAVDLAALLSQIHARGVVHTDLNPEVILLSVPGNRPTIVNFDRATMFSGERPGYAHSNSIMQRLVYLAPEQTGRTAQPVDQRADLYTLGVMLYELCAGEPPFGRGETDALSLMRDQLARLPTPVALLNPDCPRPFSDILAKLLEKEPGRRYQSAAGLLHDLKRLRQEIVRAGGGHGGRQLAAIGPFLLGDHDFPHQLTGPARLFARDADITRLRSAFAGVCSGGSNGVLVAGRAGVGKTALIDQLRPTVASAGGWFISGTFDVADSDLRSNAVVEALGALGRLLLAETESALVEQRKRLRTMLGGNASLMAGLVPDLAPVLGVAGDPPLGDPLEIQSRARQGALDVLRATASRQRPVVMVLDSLQWAAPFPLGLLDAVLTGSEIDGLLLVGAFRDDEVGEGHAIHALVPRWTQLGLWPAAIRVENLARDDLAEMLAEMLRLDRRESARLADMVGARTRGNPSETIELLNALRAEGALRLGESGWTWDATSVRGRLTGGESGDPLGGRLERLPDATVAVLEVLAALGPKSRLTVLATAAGMSLEELDARLDPAIVDGLVATTTGQAEEEGTVRFRHERSHRLLRGPGRQGRSAGLLHLTIAHRLAGDPRHLTTAAAQYVAALPELTDPAERRRAADLLERAGSAIRVTNPVTAERFYAAGMRLLDGLSQEEDEQLLLRLDLERHATVYGLGELDTMDALFESLVRRCTDPLRLNESVCLQIAALTNRGRVHEAIALGRRQLAALGTPVPPADELGPFTTAGMPDFTAWAEADDVAGDLRRPETGDAWVLARAAVLRRLNHAAFFADHDLLGWLILTSRRMWDEHGPQRHLVEALSHSSILTIGRNGDFRTGYRVVRRVLAVSTERGYEPESSYARYLCGATARPWFEPLETAIADLQHAESGLLRGGEPQAAAFSYHTLCSSMLDFSPTLAGLLAGTDQGLALAARMGNDQARQLIVSFRHFVLALRGDQPPELDTDIGLTVQPAVVGRHLLAALLAAVLGDEQSLAAHLGPVMARFPFLESGYSSSQAHLLNVLSLAWSLPSAGPEAAAELRARLEVSREWLGRRAQELPATFGHLISWIDAEVAWADGDPLAALRHFDEAILNTVPYRGWHRALIVERAGLFRQAQGHEYGARAMLTLARDSYLAWGAVAKVEQMRQRYPFLRAVTPDHEPRPHNVDEVASPGVDGTDAVDLLAVLSASQAIGRETAFDQLHARVVEVLTAMAGATDVTILLRDGEDWTSPGQGTKTLAGQGFPVSAFRYAERTGEPLLVADATRDDRFSGDEYLRTLPCCALMVVPIRSRGESRLVLVLENQLHTNAFSADRLDAVRLIAGQLAVSFENALARRRTEQEARQREKLLETVRQRERLLETLLAIQRDISHRVPLQLVLDAVTEGASGMLEGAFVALVLLDLEGSDRPNIPSVSGHRGPAETDDAVLRMASAAIEADELVTALDDGDGEITLIAAPVQVNGRIIGSLVTSAADRLGPEDWRQDLLGAFAEQVSLALNDANTLEAIREASYDSLTGLANRSLFLDRLKQALSGPADHDPAEVSVLFIDLDRFKAVNDTLGHGAGDELLAEVARRLRECIRDSDTVARLGGDEFAVLMEGTRGTAPALRAAERITTQLARPIRLAGRDIFVTASVGVAHGDAAQHETGELLRQADLAMYQAKKTGSRRAAVFEQRMQEDARDRLELQGDLRRALSENQFELVYQPLMTLPQRMPIGVETLIRWRHPERGMISPALFVPIAEETGAVIEMGRWVLVTSCRQVAAWRRGPAPDLRLNINVSARQLSDGGLAQDVVSTLAETGLPASALTLELTETVLMEDPEGITAQLSELRRLGVQVGIDDFGTGYSSLSYLRRFPVDKLKIDKSFIDNIETVEEDLAIVRTVVDLARILSLETTAEGIESEAQADLLRDVGCEVGQGYFFARPLPPEEIPSFLSRY
ncbi:EAL domain-containing protein [Kineosporia sp. J2-2]|uniref:EAL domain-containing protein n=1 Tax=Kineosporia corallincola TaxID=2835133 RepID=A0ABS5T9N4_9ACTN|nr:EAL domain-containing protein [Kineosporia corallincola]MBT0767760.1 EAL domain-containing protein [Kineosporia corallincola]